MLKDKNLIKNIRSRLHHIHQDRGLLKTRQTSKTEISAKTAKDIQSLTDFAKNLYPRSLAGLLIHVIKWWFENSLYRS